MASLMPNDASGAAEGNPWGSGRTRFRGGPTISSAAPPRGWGQQPLARHLGGYAWSNSNVLVRGPGSHLRTGLALRPAAGCAMSVDWRNPVASLPARQPEC